MTKASEKPPIRVSFYNFFHAGGIGRYTNDLLGTLARYPDLDIELMCTPQFKWQDIDGVSVWPGLTPITHPVAPMRRARFLYANWSSPRRALKRARDVDADIIHFSEFNHITYGYWRKALKNSRIKLAVSVHDVKRDKVIFNREMEDNNLTTLYRDADALFVHSRFQGQELEAFAGVDPEKVHVVPHGPYAYGEANSDPGRLRREFGLPDDATVALSFGQVRDEKNIDGLIRAMPLCRKPFHLIVAGQAGGRHKDAAYYLDLARQLGVADRVHMRDGYVPAEEVGDLFSVADWVALPYVKSFSSQSGVLNVAAHYQCPVLVSEAPVLRETVVESDIGIAAVDNSPPALARAIDKMHIRLLEQYPFAFAHYKKKYSWEENARVTREVYRRLMYSKQGTSPQTARNSPST